MKVKAVVNRQGVARSLRRASLRSA